ncbi:MAG: S41 family peptidase [Cellulosilyticaceae bacterium]
MKRRMLVGMGVGVLIGCIGVGSIYAFGLFGNRNKGKVEVNGKEVVFDKGKIAYINQAIETYYIDQVEEDDLTEGLYRGYVYGLEDPYTMYLSADEFNKQKEESVGNYVGTGIKYAWGLTNQYLIVTEVIKGSPAEAADIKIGDKITAIDGTPAMGSNEVQIYDKLMYSGSDIVNYTVVDNDGSNERHIPLKASLVTIELVKSELLDNGVGYILLDGIVKGTADEVATHIEQLKMQGATRLIIDLRDTYSDNIDETLKLCDLFLDAQQVFTVKNYKDETISYDTLDGKYTEPLVVLTSRYTQGALEAFVATMQEQKRATIIGEKTTGNGTVQERIALEDGSGLVVTTGVIYTAQNQVIRDKGVTPDMIQKPMVEGTLELVTTGTLSKEKDGALQKALEVLK